MHDGGAIDPDDLDTWPDALREALEPYAADVPIDTPTAELSVPLDDSYVTELLDGRPMRAYHCTRLLPHEVAGVRRDGLRALSRDHADGRIAAALDAGALSSADAARVLAATLYATDDGEWGSATEHRDGRVFGVVGSTQFRERPHGFDSLLSTWGGEAVYFPSERTPLAATLRALGRPSVVVLDLDLHDGVRTDVGWTLADVLTAHVALLADRGGTFTRFGDVPRSQIVDIWQPGSPAYDRFVGLPTV